MSVNKLALIRYRTIDQCLRNRYRKWTLEDLIEKVSEVLYDNEGISSGISRRTIQADIQLMRSDKLGYNAPIIVKEKKYYMYEDAGYSITNAPVNDADLEKMKEVVGLLKQFNGFSYFEEMTEMIAKLENSVYKNTHQGRNYIQFENNHLLKGLQFINPLYQAIIRKQSLLIDYQSFKAAKSSPVICYPYLLKEYRNRWFLILKPKRGTTLLTFALDRIIELQELPKEKFVDLGIDFDQYFSNLIGVTKSEKDPTHKVVLQVNKFHAPYVLTKPIHQSQQLLRESEDGSIIVRIDVVLNFELERELLGFGDFIKVLAPRILVSRLKQRLEKTISQYG